MSEYYRLDARKLTWTELRGMAPGFRGWVLTLLVRVFRLPIDFKTAYARPEALAIVDREQVGEGALLRMDTFSGPLKALGFQEVFFAEGSVISSTSRVWTSGHLRSGGEVFASVVDVEQSVQIGEQIRETHSVLWSRLRAGRFLSTHDHSLSLGTPEVFGAESCPGLAPEELLARHLERLREAPALGEPVTVEELPAVALALSQMEADFFLGRGVYVPMEEDELEALRNPPPQTTPPPRPDTAGAAWKSLLLWIFIFSLTVLFWNYFRA